jgi:O-methyltransferase
MKNKFTRWGYYFLKRRLPFFIVLWYLTRKNISQVRNGYRLVPEKELEEKYIKSLSFLLERVELIGDYLEFGVFCGSSMVCMYKALERTGLHDIRLIGFDSFKGLPSHAIKEGWREGDFAMSLQFAECYLSENNVDRRRIHLIEGWFSDTLNDDTMKKYDLKRSCIVMIDCDMYSSTREVLEFIAPLLGQVNILFFDDWFSLDHLGENLGQKKAFTEFLRENQQFAAIPFDKYGENGKIFIIEQNA